MDIQLLRKRIDAIETACTAAERVEILDRWVITEDATVRINTRRVRELISLARIGLNVKEADQ